MKKNIIIIIITAIITTIICCTAFYFISNFKNNTDEAQSVSDQSTENNTNIADNNSNENQNNEKEEKQKVYDIEGFEIAGTIEIPKINISKDVYTKVTKNRLDYGFGIATVFSGNKSDDETGNKDYTLNSIGNTLLANHF